MKKISIVFGLAIMAAMPALARDDIKLGRPSYGGSGCPRASAAVVLSPNNKSLSILFDRFMVEAGRKKAVARKTCNIAIPLRVPQGLSVSVFKIDYRGFNSLPYGAYSRFNVKYTFATSPGPRYTRTFRGRQERDFMLTNNLRASALVWSRCGRDVILRANTAMMVRTNRSKDDAFATVDSADVDAGLIYHLRWRRC